MLELAIRAKEPCVREAFVQALIDSGPKIARIKVLPEAQRFAKYVSSYNENILTGPLRGAISSLELKACWILAGSPNLESSVRTLYLSS